MSRSGATPHHGRPLAALAVDRLGSAADRSQSDHSQTRAPGILFCGGFHSSMRGNKAEYLRGLSAQQGWAFTRFDYRGHGESPGELADLCLHDWLDDTLGVLCSLPPPVVIVGSSMGAWLAVLAALREPTRVHSLLTLAAAPDFTSKLIWPGLAPQQRTRLNAGETVMLPSRYDEDPPADGWPLHRRLFDSGRALSLLNDDRYADATEFWNDPDDGKDAGRPMHSAGALRCPLHMIHGTADTVVPMQHSQRLFELAGSADASLLLLKGADHRLSDPASLARIGQTLRALMTSEPLPPATTQSMPGRPTCAPTLPEVDEG